MSLLHFASLIFYVVLLADLGNASTTFEELGTTNAERFRRGLPPLQPRTVQVSGHPPRHVHPVRPRSAGASCPSNTPQVPCTRNCAYIGVSDASSSDNLGFLYPQSSNSHFFGVTPCVSLAAVFNGFPDMTYNFTLFEVAQDMPADPTLPYIGLAGGDSQKELSSSSTDIVFLTSTSTDDPQDPNNLQPNANSPFGVTGEATVWSYGSSTTELILAWTNAPDQGTIAVFPVWNHTSNILLATGDPTDVINRAPGTATQVVFSVLPIPV